MTDRLIGKRPVWVHTQNPMLAITQELIQQLQTPARHDYHHIEFYCDVIGTYGDASDADALVTFFLKKPFADNRESVLVPIATLGNASIAKRIADVCLDGLQLKAEVATEVLQCLGAMQYEPAKNVLMHYITNSDYHWEVQQACLGLMCFEDLTPYKETIEQEISKCMGKNLFSEFVPMLACRTDNSSLKDALYQLGNTTASTDCNAGIILGIALYEDKPLFKRILWDNHWEAAGSGTGTIQWTLTAMRLLSVSFSELFADLLVLMENTSDVIHNWKPFQLFLDLLEAHVMLSYSATWNYQPHKKAESCVSIWQSVFEPESSSLSDLARKYIRYDQELQSHYLDRVQHLKEKVSLKKQSEEWERWAVLVKLK
ncbi:hypothetical protein [Xanthocytophaga flava]|nr:hypothetical protein [Xanthocytophaga flavus]